MIMTFFVYFNAFFVCSFFLGSAETHIG